LILPLKAFSVKRQTISLEYTGQAASKLIRRSHNFFAKKRTTKYQKMIHDLAELNVCTLVAGPNGVECLHSCCTKNFLDVDRTQPLHLSALTPAGTDRNGHNNERLLDKAWATGRWVLSPDRQVRYGRRARPRTRARLPDLQPYVDTCPS
jgi:hypothetical protein